MSRYDEIGIAPRTLTTPEQVALLRVTGEHRDGFRDHLIIGFALGTALREMEILALDVGDVFDEEGRAKRRVQLRVFKRSNKDTKMQQVILPDRLRLKLQKFRGWKSRRGESLEPSAPLFVSRKGNRLSTRQVRRLMHQWQKRAGSEKSHNFHTLRHSACTNLYRKTKDVRMVQILSRHLSLQNVMRYTHPTDEDLLQSVQSLLC